MRITKQAKREAKSLFRSCLVGGVIDEERVRQALREVTALKPRGYLGILMQFKRLLQLELARRSARIETAIELTGDLREQLQANLTRGYGPGLNFAFIRNPELIGGARIQVGSDVYDGSIRGRLAQLSQAL